MQAPAGRIALEEHWVLNSPEHIERWKTLAPMIPDAILNKILPPLIDIGPQRIETMDKAGIDFCVISNVGSVQGNLDPTPAMRLARQANDYLAMSVQKHPDRFAAFATVPLQDPKAGADELERATRQLGLKGVMLFGHTNGQYLDHDRFSPFWERAEALGVPVYLHAADAAVMPVTYVGRPELLGSVWSWTAETAGHTLRLIFGGVFTRYPRTKFILGHLGETLPYLFERLDYRARAFSIDGKFIVPSEIFKRNITITTAGAFDDNALLCAMRALGEDKIMFSVDHPFEDMAGATRWLIAAPISDASRRAIFGANAQRILAL